MNNKIYNIAIPILFAFTMFTFWNDVVWLRVTAICYGLGLWLVPNTINRFALVSGEEQ